MTPRIRSGKNAYRAGDFHGYLAKRMAIFTRKGMYYSREELKHILNVGHTDLEIALDYFSKNYPKEYKTWSMNVQGRGPKEVSRKFKENYQKLAEELVTAKGERRKEIMSKIKYSNLERLALEEGGVFKEALEVYLQNLPKGHRARLERKLEGYDEERLTRDIRSLAVLLVPVRTMSRVLGMKRETILARINTLRGDLTFDRALEMARKVGKHIYSRDNGIDPGVILDLVEIRNRIRKGKANTSDLIARLYYEPKLHEYKNEILDHVNALDAKDVDLSQKAFSGLLDVMRSKKIIVFGSPREDVYKVIEEGLVNGKKYDEIAKDIAKKFGIKQPTKNAVKYHIDVVKRRILAREGLPHYPEILEEVKKGELEPEMLPLTIGLDLHRRYIAGKVHPIVKKEIDRLFKKAEEKKGTKGLA